MCIFILCIETEEAWKQTRKICTPFNDFLYFLNKTVMFQSEIFVRCTISRNKHQNFGYIVSFLLWHLYCRSYLATNQVVENKCMMLYHGTKLCNYNKIWKKEKILKTLWWICNFTFIIRCTLLFKSLGLVKKYNNKFNFVKYCYS